jgi:hypothetical protein
MATHLLGKNDVFINEHDLIEIIVNGDQTIESVQAMGNETTRLARKQIKAGKRALVLDNLLQIGNVPPEALSRVAELARSNEYEKLAMVGQDKALRIGANFILKAVGRGRKVKYFEDYQDAVEWLLKT